MEQPSMSALEAAEKVLAEADQPLHYRDLTQKMIETGLWESNGRTPAASVNAMLAVDIDKNGKKSRFRRVDRGVFGLAEAITSKKKRKKAPELSMKEARQLAVDILKGYPEGMRYGELVSAIAEQSPPTPRSRIQGAVWNLDTIYPQLVSKPSRGLFLVAEQNAAIGEQSDASRPDVREQDFYESFADWLKNDISDASDAVALGGSALRTKWGTPDVVGTYRPKPSDRIRFTHEIVSAEIKADPAAPVVAFGQAVAYRLFSTKTYVVMPKTMAQDDLDRLESLCMLFGVGLVMFSLDPEKPDYVIRMRAQRFSPDMYYVNVFAEHLHRTSSEMFDRLFQ